MLDIRSTPAWTHDELGDACSSAALESEVVVTSERLVPCETPADSRLLEVRRARCVPRPRPSAARPAPTGCSSATATRSRCGPGTSRRSHTADEYVDLAEVTAAREFYARREEYLQ